jgi:phosphatidylglycerophosphate synthase
MARIRLKEIVDSLPPGRIRTDSPLTIVLFRPLSFMVAWLFLAMGWSANAVTYLSAALCLAGFAFLVSGPLWAAWVGLGLFFIFDILDCTDGNMARVRKTASPWGEWVDAFGGYTAYTTILLGAGVVAQAQSAGALPGIQSAVLPWAGGWALVGGASAAANLFMRTIYQARRAIKADPGRASVSLEKRLSEYLGITGALLPLLALGLAFGFLPWVVASYAVFYCGGCLLVSVKLIRRVEAEGKS